MHGTSAIADARRGEDGAASVGADRGAYREVAAADDADHEDAVVGARKMARPTAGAGGCDSVG
jgi:hypothetical protein